MLVRNPLEEVEQFVRTQLLDPPAGDGARDGGDPRRVPWGNWWLSKENGGPGLSLRDGVDVVAALAYGDAGVAFTSFVPVVGVTMVSLFGAKHLHEQFLEPLAGGRHCALLGSEREAGSELGRMQTRVQRRGTDVVLDGRKMFSTNADLADFLVVLARSDAGDGPPYVAVVVPRHTPGVHVEKQWTTLGLTTSPVHEVSFQECVVPGGNVLDGHGLRLLEVALNPSRTLIAATALGMARRVRDLCMDYAETRQLKGAPLTKNPVFGNKMAQMEVGIEVMHAQCAVAARDFDEVMAGPDPASSLAAQGTLKSALVAKTFCGQTGWQIASVGSEALGGLGYTDESLVGRVLRDMRYVSLVEGGDEVLRELIYTRYVAPKLRRSWSSLRRV